MAGQIATLVVKIQASLAEFSKQLDDASGQVEKMGKKMTGSAGVATVALGNLAAMGAEKALSAIISLGNQLISVGGHLTDLSSKTGISTKALQELEFAAGQVGIPLETLTGAIQKLGAKLATGDKGAAAALKEIGISVKDIQGLKPEEVFYKVGQGMDTVDSAGKRAAIAVALFGKAGAEALPGLTKEFVETAQSAERLGIIIGSETLAAADELGDQMDVLKAQMFALIANALKPILPLLVELMKSLGQLAQAIIPPLVQAFVWMMETTAKAQKVFLEFLLSIVEGVQKIPGFGKAFGIADGAAEALRVRIAATDERIKALAGTATAAAPPVKNLGRNLAETGDGALGAAPKIDKAAEALKDLKASMFGEEAIKKAELYLTALGDLKNISKLTKEKQEELANAMKAGHAAMVASGRGAEALAEKMSLVNVIIADLGSIKIPKFVQALNSIPQSFILPDIKAAPAFPFEAFAMPDWVTDSMSRHVDEMKKIIPEAAQVGKEAGQVFGAEFGKDLGNLILKGLSGGGDVGASIGAKLALTAAQPFMEQIEKVFGGKGVKGAIGGAIATGATVGLAALGSKLIKSDTVGQQVGGSMGAAIGGNLVQGLAKTVASTVGGTLGATLGSVVPVLGTIAGGALGSLIGGLFGPSQASQTKKARAEWIEAAGGLKALEETAKQAGVSLDSVMKADTLKKFDAATKAFTKSVEEASKEMEGFAKSLGKVAKEKTLLSPELLKQMDKLGGKEALSGDMFAFLQASTQTAADGLSKFFDNAKVGSQSAASAMGLSFGAVFENFREQGLSSTEAFAALAPAMTAFQAQLTATGLSGGAAFAELNAQMMLVTSTFTGPMIQGAEGVADIMVGLANSGRMNQEIFAGLSGQVAETFHTIEGSGAGSVKAVQALQRPLQTIYELWQDQGFAVDEATMEVLQFGIANNVVGDQFRSKQDQMMIAVEKLVERIDKLVSVMTDDLPAGAEAGASGIEKALGGIKVPTISIPYRYDAINSPPAPLAGTNITTDLSGVAVNSNISVQVDGRELATVTARNMPGAIAPYGIAR